jgi:hypothetical protein
VDYLVRLHADLGGRILANKAEAKRLAENMRHVEAVLKMFDPGYNVRAIAARRRQKTNPWFKRGTLFREALGVLRTATAPMTVTELTHGVLAAHGLTDTADRKQRLGIESGIRAALEHHAGKTVQRVGEGVPKRWQLKDE